MASGFVKLGGFALAVFALVLAVAPRALACMPGCSGYHLTFTGPASVGGSALALADRSVTVTWQDTVDGASATFDVLMSKDPVPAYPMHSFPAELPGDVLALGLSATAQSSWTWDTSQVQSGTYFLYSVFHNSPFNTLVMPFAAVTVSHASPSDGPVAPAVLIRTPRGTSAVGGTVEISLDAAPGTPAGTSLAASAGPPSADTIDLYAGSPPDAADGTLVATGLAAAVAQTVQWDSSLAGSGSYVFKAVLRDPSGNVLATAFSPGIVEVGPQGAAAGSCQTGAGSIALAAPVLVAGLGLRLRRRPKHRRS
jgi:hypothetical protein